MTETALKHRFYCPVSLRPGSSVELDDRVSQQIRRVLRLRPGDAVTIFDGSGREAIGRIDQFRRKAVKVEIIGEPTNGIVAGPPAIQLGIALLKADRFDLVVQKATELGVTTITPLECTRSVVTLSADRVRSRMERWQRIAIEALEQCGRSDFVEIRDPVPFEELLPILESDLRFIAREDERSNRLVDRLDTDPGSVSILIGPEGGFTPEEAELAEENGFESVSLGSTVLRSETAAIAAVALIQAFSRNPETA